MNVKKLVQKVQAIQRIVKPILEMNISAKDMVCILALQAFRFLISDLIVWFNLQNHAFIEILSINV